MTALTVDADGMVRVFSLSVLKPENRTETYRTGWNRTGCISTGSGLQILRAGGSVPKIGHNRAEPVSPLSELVRIWYLNLKIFPMVLIFIEIFEWFADTGVHTCESTVWCSAIVLILAS